MRATNTAAKTRRMPPVDAALTSMFAEGWLVASTVVIFVSVVDVSLVVLGLVVSVEFVVVGEITTNGEGKVVAETKRVNQET